MLSLFVCLAELDNKATLSDHILTAVLGLLKKEVPEHGRHLQQYFHFFLMYSMIGPPEVCTIRLIARSSQSLLNRCSGLKGNWSFLYLLSRFDTSRFDTNSSSETAQNFRSLQVKFAVEPQKKTFWVNILRSLSQVRETIYTSKELASIETAGNRLKKCLRRYRCSAGSHL